MDADRPLTIAEITSVIKEILESSFPKVYVEGEISNCRPSSTGHLYFTLKDETSSIQAVLFKGKGRYLSFTPKDGELVHVRGNISVYEARGTYQIIVDSMSRAGSGDILRLLEELKQKLASEGLFDQDRKKPIPALPFRVAVVTSPTGAAIRDVLQIIKRRNDKISVTVFPAPVQGTEAAPLLADQIRRVNALEFADVILLCRGGGSLEDLLPFSDERLVRAVAASSIPVISAVGHEIDWSLCDFASDLRAPTPSAAAELVSPLQSDVYSRIETARNELTREMSGLVEKARLLMGHFSGESLELRLRRIIHPFIMRVDDAREGLVSSLGERIEKTRNALALNRQILEGANPRTILGRGYAMVRDSQTGAIIRSAADTEPGRTLELYPARGKILARVEALNNEEL